MTTTANSFLANGPAAIGFDARPSFAPHWFKFGALAVGHTAGVFGATNDVVTIPPGVNISAAVWGASMRSYGVLGQCLAGSAPGIRGEGGTGPGVEAFSSNNSGVSGAAGAWPSTFPPAGFDWQAGVSGQSQDHPAVTGFSINQYAFQGFSTNNTGVLGVAGGKGPDVLVPVPGNIAGVVGSSDQRPGVIGTSKASRDGVYGFSHAGAGVVGETDSATAYAGAFSGNVAVNGLFSAAQVAAQVKAAVVPFPDGSKRLLYCMESPDHWFEDFGTARLKRGRATVKLDADFAKAIVLSDYRVFLTPEGDCQGLYVRKRRGSFEVRELQGGTSNVAFSYRIVGGRKDIRRHKRFPKIDARVLFPPRQFRTLRGRKRGHVPSSTRALFTTLAKGVRKQRRKRSRAGSARRLR